MGPFTVEEITNHINEVLQEEGHLAQIQNRKALLKYRRHLESFQNVGIFGCVFSYVGLLTVGTSSPVYLFA